MDTHDVRQSSEWALQNTGFDPDAPDVPPHQRVTWVLTRKDERVTSSGASDRAVDSTTGSVPWYEGNGTPLRTDDTSALKKIQASQVQQCMLQYQLSAEQARRAELELGARDYQRAAEACFEGRGYSVNPSSLADPMSVATATERWRSRT